MQAVMDFVNNSVYFFQAIVALWGIYCVIVVWTRTGQKRFKSFDLQTQFLDALDQPLKQGNFEAAAQLCEGDQRAVCQLALLAMVNRKEGYAKSKNQVLETFQRDVLSDIEHRLVGVNTAIKTEPMLGLLGTVLGMMAAFGKLATSENVQATALAEDISFALITTAVGLAISIPLMFALAKINVRIRKMEELTSSGLGRFFDSFKTGLDAASRRPARSA